MEHGRHSLIHPANRPVKEEPDSILPLSLRNHGFDGQPDPGDPYATPQLTQTSNTTPLDHASDFYEVMPRHTDDVSFSASPTQSKTFAARSKGRPELSLNTARTSEPDVKATAEPSVNGVASPTAISNGSKGRKSSVPDRSPLQTLETKLGDISKEEKRARLEEAEAMARRRASSRGDTLERAPEIKASHHNTARQSSISSSAAGRGNTRKVSDGTSRNPHGSVRDHTRYPSSGSFRSNRGHDTLLTGGAAAAAVSAYQAGLKRSSYSSVPIERVDNTHGEEDSSPNMPEKPHSKDMTAPFIHQSNQLRDTADSGYQTQQPANQPISQTSQSRPSTGGDLDRDLGGSGILTKPQEQKPTTKSRGNLRFSDIVYRNKQSTRRYQEPDYLDEFRNTQTACLTGPDLDLDSDEPKRTWWEKSTPQAKVKGTPKTQLLANGSDRKPIPPSVATHFEPALKLKCGPLLRFRGIGGSLEQELWKGSIMIVTEDETSSYQEPPTLRLFRQSQTPQSHSNAANSLGKQSNNKQTDPLAGVFKVSKTGGPVYVRPASDILGGKDLSRLETNNGLFETRSVGLEDPFTSPTFESRDGEQVGRYCEVQGCRLHVERGYTFWKFNIEVELMSEEMRIAYRINNSPAIGFWVPPKNQSMNIMFHSCNGFSLSVDTDTFSGPDPLWRDVLVSHQQRPFHCMVGGGDQIYNDAAMQQTVHFQEWLAIKNPEHKHSAHFTVEMQDELEQFYLDRYAMWFSQGLFGLANSQIPMVNIWDDHDIIDGYGSYPDHFMKTSVFSGLGEVAFKYYMLFQHQSIPEETQKDEPSWLLGFSRGPYINHQSRSLFMHMGKPIAFLGLDCRTERMRDSVLSEESYDLVFDRCRDEIVQGQTKHLIVLLGIPIAYPRFNFLENILTSRVMDPIKALGRTGLLGNFVNKFDGGVEILDDLDDHWTAKHHKHERNWLIQELQELAAEKSIRVTILGGDVHLAACGQFYSNPKLGIPKDQDHRYMPNVISSAIVNTPPPEMMSDVLNKRNKIHHLDKETDENMIPLFPHDVDGTARNNTHLLPRRNWCSIKEYVPSNTPPPSAAPEQEEIKPRRSFSLRRSLSRNRNDPNRTGFLSRLSTRKAPPSSFRAPAAGDSNHDIPNGSNEYAGANEQEIQRTNSFDDGEDELGTTAHHNQEVEERGRPLIPRSRSFTRRPASLSRKLSKSDPTGRAGFIDLEGGLDISIHCEINQKDPRGLTVPYRLLIPALHYQGRGDIYASSPRGKMSKLMNGFGRRPVQKQAELQQVPYEEAVRAGTPPLGQRAYNKPINDAHQIAFDNSQNIPADDANLPFGPDAAHQNDRSVSSHSREMLGQSSDPGIPCESSEVFRTPETPQRNVTKNVQPTMDAALPTKVESEPQAVQPATATTVDAPAPLPQSAAPPGLAQGSQALRGPAPPSNIDQLPASIQKRYSQFEPFAEAPLLPASIDQLRVSRKHAIQPGAEVHRSVSGPTRAYATTSYPSRSATYHAPPSEPMNSNRNSVNTQPKLSPLGSAPVDFIPPQNLGTFHSYQSAQSGSQGQNHRPVPDQYAAYLDSPSDSLVSGEHTRHRKRPSKLDRYFGGGEGTNDDDYDDFHGRYHSGGPNFAGGGYESEEYYEEEPKTGRFGRLVRKLSEGARQHKPNGKKNRKNGR